MRPYVGNYLVLFYSQCVGKFVMEHILRVIQELLICRAKPLVVLCKLLSAAEQGFDEPYKLLAVAAAYDLAEFFLSLRIVVDIDKLAIFLSS